MGVYFGIQLKVKTLDGQAFAVFGIGETVVALVDGGVGGRLYGWREDLTIIQRFTSESKLAGLPIITSKRPRSRETHLVLMKDYDEDLDYCRIVEPNCQAAKTRSIIRSDFLDIVMLGVRNGDMVCTYTTYKEYSIYVVTKDGVNVLRWFVRDELHKEAFEAASIDSDRYDEYLAEGRLNDRYWHDVDLKVKRRRNAIVIKPGE